MTELRYPLSALDLGLCRGVAGIVICFVILVTNEWQNQLVWLFVGLTILFAIYTMTTIAKNLARFRVSEEGIECGAFRKADNSLGRSRRTGAALLSDISQPQKGLDVADPEGQGRPGRARRGSKLAIESTLPGFSEIATRAAHAAQAKTSCMVDRVTADNLAAIGVSA